MIWENKTWLMRESRQSCFFMHIFCLWANRRLLWPRGLKIVYVVRSRGLGSVQSESESEIEIARFRNWNLIHELRSVSYLQSESELETYDGELQKSEIWSRVRRVGNYKWSGANRRWSPYKEGTRQERRCTPRRVPRNWPRSSQVQRTFRSQIC